jgi:hypothetical protein
LVQRHSDTLSPKQLEKQIHDETERQYDWIEHHPNGEAMFTPTRVCHRCAFEDRQEDMRWTGVQWLCPRHYDEMMLERALGSL